MPFKQADLLIQKLDSLVALGHIDPFIKSNFVGLIAVTCVTSFEIRLRTILCEFSKNQHTLFGCYVENSLKKINGKITIGDIKGLHLNKFGSEYIKKFDQELNILKANASATKAPDPCLYYDSLINARHNFVHQNKMPDYDEMKSFYLLGIEIMNVLQKVLSTP